MVSNPIKKSKIGSFYFNFREKWKAHNVVTWDQAQILACAPAPYTELYKRCYTTSYMQPIVHAMHWSHYRAVASTHKQPAWLCVHGASQS